MSIQKMFKSLRGQRGFTLVEVVIAVAILAAIGVTFIGSVYIAYKGAGMLDEQTQAEALIRSQLDDIKNSDYQVNGVYPVTVDVPSQYSVSINVEVLDTQTCIADGNCNTLQKITVAVSRPVGDGERPVLSVSTYKVKKN
jgi:prepilin-type N-terminal cleavage/methylation domain-containing protein